MQFKKTRTINVLLVIFILCLSVLISTYFNIKNVQFEKQRATAIVTAYQESIIFSLKHGFNYSDELASILSETHDSSRFEDSAQRIMKQPGMLRVELFEHTTLTHSYPPGNPGSSNLGKDILELDYAYTLARITGQTVVEGPCIQNGKNVFLIISPLMQNNTFTGAVAIALDSQYILQSFHLEHLTQSGYAYELWRIHPLDGHKETITASPANTDFSNSIDASFQLPTAWTLSVIPINGWSNRCLLVFMAVSSITIATLLAVLLYLYQQKNHLENEAAISRQTEQESGLLTLDSFIRQLTSWTEKQLPFSLLYIEIPGYARMAQISTPEQKQSALNHIVDCLLDYVKSQHLTARIGESHFIIAMKENEISELANIQKGLALDLLYKIDVNDEKIFLTASSELCCFPQDASTPQDLLQTVVKNYYQRISLQNPAHDMTQICERIIAGESDVLFGEYADIEMNRLSKALTRLRKFLRT